MFDKLIIKWFCASLPKKGNHETENEDKYTPVLNNGAYFQVNEFKCAISDGATESSFSKIWANHLVNEYILSNYQENQIFISKAKRKWRDDILSIEHTWASNEKLKKGSFATFTGLHLLTGNRDKIFPLGGVWKAGAVGDSCLFHFRGETVLNLFPLDNSNSFSNHPHLIGTETNNGFEFQTFSGSWKSGDDFFLMTDAISEWSMKNIQLGKNISGIIKDKLSRKTRTAFFSEWIKTLRSQREIKNDDTTVIWIKVY